MAVIGKTSGLHPVLLAALESTSNELGVILNVISGRRSREEQAHWWNCYQVRRRTGVCRCTSCNPAFPPGQSWHEEDESGWGQAVDVYVGGTALRNYPGGDQAARRHGVHAPFATEPWHYQPVSRLGRTEKPSPPNRPNLEMLFPEEIMHTTIARDTQTKVTVLVGPAGNGLYLQPVMSAESEDNHPVAVEWLISDTDGTPLAWSGEAGKPGNRCLTVGASSPHSSPSYNIRDIAGRPDKGLGKRALNCLFINRGPGVAGVTINPDIGAQA